jgi:hypothetical protein
MKTVLIVGGDLMARARIDQAADAASMTVERMAVDALGSLAEVPSADLVILDLDSGGRALVDAWASLAGDSGPRAFGYFSHVDSDLGDHARAGGIEAVPRGRFWRTIEATLATL